jgi:hypothetical protein
MRDFEKKYLLITVLQNHSHHECKLKVCLNILKKLKVILYIFLTFFSKELIKFTSKIITKVVISTFFSSFSPQEYPIAHDISQWFCGQ